MLDSTLRPRVGSSMDRLAAGLDRPRITPDRLTLAGLALGLASAAAATQAWWGAALVLWLVSRVADGVDGALARRRRQPDAPTSQAGGFLDITADFIVYGSFVVGVAIGTGGPYLPFLLVLLAYYINGTAFLAFSSLAERSGRQIDDGRSLSFLGGLAEGTETIVVHSLWVILPAHAAGIAWVWFVVVAISASHRVVAGYRALA
jgi:phosphatidylglycerophosphate synthase